MSRQVSYPFSLCLYHSTCIFLTLYSDWVNFSEIFCGNFSLWRVGEAFFIIICSHLLHVASFDIYICILNVYIYIYRPQYLLHIYICHIFFNLCVSQRAQKNKHIARVIRQVCQYFLQVLFLLAITDILLYVSHVYGK